MRFAIAAFVIVLAGISVLGQAPTLRIQTDDPNLPSDLYYGNIKVKPLRLRPGTNQPITIDDSDFFVQQQYIDFLNRMPEAGGFQGWLDTLNHCSSGDTTCDRIHVSGSFFQSDEFATRGYYTYRFYSVGFGRKPDFAEFMPDLRTVSGFLTPAQLEAAKVAFVNSFMARPAFANAYNFPNNSQGNADFVNALCAKAGVTLSNQQALIDSLNSNPPTLTRAQVLRQIVESNEVNGKYYNQAFVVMQYFGYLRRDPDILYLDWIKVLDANPADSRHMIDGFMNSSEYRGRF